jgi:iron complex outermembrane receptor protein/hemoglobin/transferrin/lactoferrin receptor protein
VTQRDLEERQPRSAPDALRYEPGVYIQESSAAQASAFVRGRTGQQTVILFDGIRLNHSLYRHGPNQYFFLVDLHTIEAIDVLRGGASTRYGSDAIAGVVHARPALPRPGDLLFRPTLHLRGATADGERGGRAQIDARLTSDLTLAFGVGYRSVGLLESGGPIVSPETGERPKVPTFAEDQRTQLGTGFDELTADLRLVYELGAKHRLTAAAYAYRQTDAPRTDQCPPESGRIDECLVIDEQFRTLSYLALDTDLGPLAATARFALSFQRHHERRTRDRPSGNVENGGRDDVNTFGAAAQLSSAWRSLAEATRWRLHYGADAYHDRIDSTAWTVFTDVGSVHPLLRGQYLAGSTYTTGGAFVEAEATHGEWLTLRGGGRLGGAHAATPVDPESGSRAENRTFTAVVGYAGLELAATRELTLLSTVDRSYRAPNLDDLTGRLVTGPGFQFANAALGPEHSLTVEAGARFSGPRLAAEVWLFHARLDSAIARAQRQQADCPAESRDCAASWYQYQLVNLPEPATIVGAEASLRIKLPRGLEVRGVISYARGEGPPPEGPRGRERVPLSRIPPLHGNLELSFRGIPRLEVAASVRASLTQDRLALSDRSDPRIPRGGTPGMSVVNLRAGYRVHRYVQATLVLDNLFDAAYRYHGSSLNGPGRGLIVSLEASR